jgi:endonuclease/exonuclease/phosphatase (EEP) superfamily protein YafD
MSERIKARSDFLKLKVHASGLIVAAGALACLATLAGMVGKFHWLLDLCSHFPVQCAVFLLISGVILAVLRKRATCAVFIVFALLNVFSVLPQMVPSSHSEGFPRVHLATLLINVRTDNREFSRVRDLVRARKPDIVVFEE